MADPGFDLTWWNGLCQCGVGGGGNIERVDGFLKEKSFLACFCHISIKIWFKMKRERIERKNRQISVWDLKKV